MPIDPATRHRVMASIRKRDTKPELRVRRALYARGMRYRVNVATLPGTPDVVFAGARVVVQIQGCFWHQHPGCSLARKPRANAGYWEPKLRRNIIRDSENGELLSRLGWRLVVIWECQTRNERQLAELVDAVEMLVRDHGKSGGYSRTARSAHGSPIVRL